MIFFKSPKKARVRKNFLIRAFWNIGRAEPSFLTKSSSQIRAEPSLGSGATLLIRYIKSIGVSKSDLSFMDGPLGLIRYHIMASPYYGNISYKIYQIKAAFYHWVPFYPIANLQMPKNRLPFYPIAFLHTAFLPYCLFTLLPFYPIAFLPYCQNTGEPRWATIENALS